MPYRQVHTTLLSEPWFEPLTSQVKWLFVSILINPMTSPSGFLVASDARLSFNSSIPIPELPLCREALVSTNKLKLFPGNLYWVVRYWRWQGNSSPKWQRHVATSLKGLPENILSEFKAEYPPITYPYLYDTYPLPSEGYPGNSSQAARTITTEEEEQQKNINNTSLPHRRLPVSAAFSDLPGKNSLFPELRVKFPFLDLDDELHKCSLWWTSSRKKVKSPELAFVNWLKKAEEIRQKGRPNGKTVDIGPWDIGG